MWAAPEFSVALSELHGRNVSSLIRAADLAYEKIGFSFSKALGNTFGQAIAGIFAKKEMETDKMLQGHVQATVALEQSLPLRGDHSEPGDALLQPPQPPAPLWPGPDPQAAPRHPAAQRAGPGRGRHAAGACLPAQLDKRRAWCFYQRAGEVASGIEGCQRCLGGVGKPVVLVQDREADVFTFFTAKRSSNVELVVRVCQPRRIEVLGKEAVLPLQQAAQQLTEQGELETQIRRGNRPVKLRLQVKAGEVAVLPPKDTKQAKARNLQLVMAREIAATDEKGNDVFKAEQAACWLLLTTCEVEDAAAAFQVVEWYALRWPSSSCTTCSNQVVFRWRSCSLTRCTPSSMPWPSTALWPGGCST